MEKIRLLNVYCHGRKVGSMALYKERWHLSSAYDLTYSSSVGGEHATTVYGNGMNPGITEILAIAKEIGIQEKRAKIIANDIKECVKSMVEGGIAKNKHSGSGRHISPTDMRQDNPASDKRQQCCRVIMNDI